jgi:signal transduction histidine kinase
VDLRIDVTDKLLSLVLRDGGPSRREDQHQGYGLVGIRERAAFLGGHARIGPDDSGGWEVSVAIPLDGTRQPESMPEGTHR